jgi:hypothetical protein
VEGPGRDSKPGAAKTKPGATKSKPGASKSKSGATKSKLESLRRIQVFQRVIPDFRPFEPDELSRIASFVPLPTSPCGVERLYA